MLRIQVWEGGIGNNIFQVINGLCMCLHEGRMTLQFPKHEYFLTRKIVIPRDTFHKDQRLAHDTKVERTCFSYRNSQYVFKTYHQIIRSLIRGVFKVPHHHQEIRTSSKILHIHIRSGDIFRRTVHPLYVQPPMSFYKTVIDSQPWESVVIVSQDLKNPCTQEIQRLYPHLVRLEIGQPLSTDVFTFLNASNVMYGFGTFIPALLFLSTHVKHSFETHKTGCPWITFGSLPQRHVISVEEYLTKMGPWKNTQRQLRCMLES